MNRIMFYYYNRWAFAEHITLKIKEGVYAVGFIIRPPRKHNPTRAVAAIEWPVLATMRLSMRVWFWTWKRWRKEHYWKYMDGSEYHD